MTQYTIVLTIPNAGNKEICYSFNHEDNIYPSDYWGDKENRWQLRQFIENVHYRKISDKDLDLIIRKFISSIKSGFRGRIPITIDLPPLGTPTSAPSPTRTSVSDRDRLRDNQRTSAGSNSDYPPVKTPNPQGISGTSSGGKSQSSGTGNTRDHNGEKNQNQNPPQTETWSTTNNQSF